MRLRFRIWAAAALAAMPMAAGAASCMTQAEMPSLDRNALVAAGGQVAAAVLAQDYATLQQALLPAEAPEWEGMRTAVELAAPLVKGGQVQLQNLYLLDASNMRAPADTQFFCSNSSGSLTVTMTMHALPPGRYAVLLATAAGAPLAGQIGIVLAFDATGPTPAWKLAGLNVRQGAFDGHDGVWYWTRARELARAADSKSDPWSAWYTYEAARYMLVPVDFLSSPNLEKLGAEQSLIKFPAGGSPQDAFPLTLSDGARTWKILAVRLDTSLRQPDLAVSFESAAPADPAAARTEAVAALSAFLKAQPGLRENFHGLWAIAMKDGKSTPVIELPMAQIP